MANLTSILGTDLISASYPVINTNFQSLNANKAESSTLTSLLSAKIQVASVAGSVLSLTTGSGDVVTVWMKGFITGSATAGSVALVYNGAIKDSIHVKQAAAADATSFALMYSETPGAATANITASVIANGALSYGDVKIIAQVIT